MVGEIHEHGGEAWFATVEVIGGRCKVTTIPNDAVTARGQVEGCRMIEMITNRRIRVMTLMSLWVWGWAINVGVKGGFCQLRRGRTMHGNDKWIINLGYGQLGIELVAFYIQIYGPSSDC